MSRLTKSPITIPNGVEVNIDGRRIRVKGSKGSLEHQVHQAVDLLRENGALMCVSSNPDINVDAMVGTTRALVNNMVIGVSDGFQRRLQLVGVGYRAQMKGSQLSLALGYSHPIDYDVPEGITIETPSQPEVVVSGIDKQRVGQPAAEIRAFRPPEPYKGKGVRYSDENVVRKEAKK